jgi:hypothetical protein
MGGIIPEPSPNLLRVRRQSAWMRGSRQGAWDTIKSIA